MCGVRNEVACFVCCGDDVMLAVLLTLEGVLLVTDLWLCVLWSMLLSAVRNRFGAFCLWFVPSG